MINHDRIDVRIDKDSLAASVKPFVQVGVAMTAAAFFGRLAYDFWPLGAVVISLALVVGLSVGAVLRRGFQALKLPVFAGSIVLAGVVLLLAYLSDPKGGPPLLALVGPYLVMCVLWPAALRIDQADPPPSGRTLYLTSAVLLLAVLTFPIPADSLLARLLGVAHVLVQAAFAYLALAAYFEYLAANPDLSPEMVQQFLKLRLDHPRVPWLRVCLPAASAAALLLILAIVAGVEIMAGSADTDEVGYRDYPVGPAPAGAERKTEGPGRSPFFQPHPGPAHSEVGNGTDGIIREDPDRTLNGVPNLPLPEVFPKSPPMTLRLYPTDVLVKWVVFDCLFIALIVALFVLPRAGARQTLAVWLAPDGDRQPGVFHPPSTQGVRGGLLLAAIAIGVLTVRVRAGEQEEQFFEHLIPLLTAFRASDGERWWAMLLSFVHHLVGLVLPPFVPLLVVGPVSWIGQLLHDRWLANGLAAQAEQEKRADDELMSEGGVS